MSEKSVIETRGRGFCPRHGRDGIGCERVERLIRADVRTAEAMNEAIERRVLDFVEREYGREALNGRGTFRGIARSAAVFHVPLEAPAAGGWPPARLYLATHRAELCPAEEKWIRIELAARLSYWDVLQRIPGGGAHLGDALGDDLFTIPGAELPFHFRFGPGELVFARVLEVYGRKVLGQYDPMSMFEPWSEAVLERIRRSPEAGREARLLAEWTRSRGG